MKSIRIKSWTFLILTLISVLSFACGGSGELLDAAVVDERITIQDIQDLGFQEIVASIYDYKSPYYEIEARNDPWDGKVVIDGIKQDVRILVFFTESLDDATREQIMVFSARNGNKVMIAKNVGILCEEIEVCEYLGDQLQ
ncbi:MAG: hypothetical protein CL891_04865 [Dehalococcoidia bacterium]|nr:hypothetical protein [Dehalococcoidia bacterium]|tara:strand:+ start:441 stop:863 length:423 start_codon:yes stop_codon:yes gene_type:complete